MSREIKFRAWNKEIGKMVDLQAITPLALDATMNSQLALKGGYGIFIPILEELDIMQYTGLKDTQGKEIYEGDILEVELSKDRAFTNGQQEIFRFKVYYSEYDASFHGSRLDNGSLYSVAFKGSAVVRKEVIGNIYENSELIDG